MNGNVPRYAISSLYKMTLVIECTYATIDEQEGGKKYGKQYGMEKPTKYIKELVAAELDKLEKNLI